MTMTATAAPEADRRSVLLGMFYMCLAGSLFPVMNGLVQVLGPHYPLEQIVWWRTGGHLLFVLMLFAPRFGLVRLIRAQEPKLQIARSISLLASTLCFFGGVRYLQLAQAASISFTAPFIVAILAWAMLGEQLSFARLAAVLAGFVGVLVVIQPGSDVFQWASLAIVGSATFYAIYQVFTRRVAGRDLPETSAVYSALVGTLALTLVVPFVWVPPRSLTDTLVLCSLGVLGGLGHYCVARALTYAPASIVSPFQYWQMIGSVAVGYLLMGHLPTRTTWLGASIIIGAGIYIGWRETREKAFRKPTGT